MCQEVRGSLIQWHEVETWVHGRSVVAIRDADLEQDICHDDKEIVSK